MMRGKPPLDKSLHPFATYPGLPEDHVDHRPEMIHTDTTSTGETR
jgi:hypothetical protein